MTIKEQYRRAVKKLQAVSGEPEAEAREILAHVYGLPPGRLVMRFFDEADKEQEADEITEERLTGRPLAYITGVRNFYGRDFAVDERVLIPRYDTESVAEAAIEAVRTSAYRSACDLCCGSGCIGISLLLETDLDHVYFADISQDALDVARLNAKRLGCLSGARFVHGDFLGALPGKTDLIVCNPPYIREEDYSCLEAQVRDFEPRLALTAPLAGLYFYWLLGRDAASCLTPGGTLIAETGDGQAEAAAEILSAAGFENVRIGTDVTGKNRFVQGRSSIQHAREDRGSKTSK